MNGIGKCTTLATLGAALALLPACTKHEVEIKPVETRHEIIVQPIQITVDVNIRVDRQLDNFFDFEDKPVDDADTTKKPAAPTDTANPT